jgi:hypothetical protein
MTLHELFYYFALGVFTVSIHADGKIRIQGRTMTQGRKICTGLPTALLSHLPLLSFAVASVTMVFPMTLRRSSLFVALLCAASCLVSPVPARLLEDHGQHEKLENSNKVRKRIYVHT